MPHGPPHIGDAINQGQQASQTPELEQQMEGSTLPPAVQAAMDGGYYTPGLGGGAAGQEQTATVIGGFQPVEDRSGGEGTFGFGVRMEPRRLDQDQFFNELTSMSPEQRKEFEKQLFIMGFYNRGTDFDAVQAQSVVSADTLLAAERFFKWASTSGSEEPWYQLASDTADELAGAGVGFDPAGAGGSGSEPPTPVIQTSDPLAAGELLEQTYKKLVGKKPTDAEKRAFVAALHANEKRQQMASFNARYHSQTQDPVTIEGFDPQAQAAEFARSERPVETEAKEFVGQGDALRDMIEGGI